MPTQGRSGKPTTRRYSEQEKAQAVRLVRQLRAELGTDHGTVFRVARQLGYGTESVRAWVRQADIDEGRKPGTTTGNVNSVWPHRARLIWPHLGAGQRGFLGRVRLVRRR